MINTLPSLWQFLLNAHQSVIACTNLSTLQAAEVLCDPSKKRQYNTEQAAPAYKPSQPAAQQRRQE